MFFVPLVFMTFANAPVELKQWPGRYKICYCELYGKQLYSLVLSPYQCNSHVPYSYHTMGVKSANWASEGSPTLGCSIEISRDIYICACVCHGPKSVGGITWAKRAHAQSDL